MKNIIFLFVLFCLALFSCDDKDEVQEPFIHLSKTEMNIDYKALKDTIELKTNTNWEITNIPDWLVVSKQSGIKEDTRVILEIKENNGEKTREVEILFKASNKTIGLLISQWAKPKKEYALPRLGFSYINELTSGAYSETQPFDLEFEASGLFINSLNKDMIFPGSLFAGNATHYPQLDKVKLDGYTYNPQTIGMGGVPFFVIENFVPTYAEYLKFEKEKIEEYKGNQNLSFHASNGKEYYSRRHLHCIGLYELGMSLDELLNGKSYKEESMSYEYGLIFTASQIRFSAIMDLPSPSLLTKELDKAQFTPLRPNYIASINYGNNALLLTESDFDRGTVNSLKSALTLNATLNAEETKKAEQIDAYYIYLKSAGEFAVIRGNLIEVITEAGKIEPPLVPISFRFSDYYDNGEGTVNYKIHVE